MGTVLISTYVLLLVFVLVVIFLKIKRKEKVHPVWYCTLCVIIILPVFWLIIIGYFSVLQPEELLQSIPD
jgi:4-amino-4-deoxy-L-arabinose transferase-like glycosyltransferase